MDTEVSTKTQHGPDHSERPVRDTHTEARSPDVVVTAGDHVIAVGPSTA
jgi:hypothetical protein